MRGCMRFCARYVGRVRSPPPPRAIVVVVGRHLVLLVLVDTSFGHPVFLELRNLSVY